MVVNFTIYGERCSGTNYLQNLIEINFINKVTWEYGWKHFFGFDQQKLKKSDNTFFVCIVRNLEDWLNSLYKVKHHLALRYKKKLSKDETINEYLNKEIFSVEDAEHNYKKWTREKMTDRNIYTGKRYKNIFEMRHTKIKYMIEDLPNKVKNYIFIRYEDLINNFRNTMIKIKNSGLAIRKNINFPLNTNQYKKTNIKFKKNNKKYIPEELIWNNPNLIDYYEKKLGYMI